MVIRNMKKWKLSFLDSRQPQSLTLTTVGDPIQTIAPEELTAAVEDFDLFMEAITAITPVPIRFDEIEGSAKGYYDNA